MYGNEASNPGALLLYSGDVANEYIGLHTDTTERMRIDRDGNVGIGTITPQALLHVGSGVSSFTTNHYMDVHGSTTLLHNAYNDGGTEVYKWVGNHASFGARGIKFRYNDGISFYADSEATTANATFTPTQRMVIENGGNVGIGTTSPSSLLHV